MQIEYHKFWSESLGQDMELKLYGHAGKPMFVFPSSWNHFYEYEDRGMVAACENFINAGKLMIVAVDSMDAQSWLNKWAHPADRAIRHNQYDNYIVREVNHFIRNHRGVTGKFITTGCSLGAYHALNFLLRHPDVFDTTIALSGAYTLDSLIGDYVDENVYYNSPMRYLPNLDNSWYLDQYRQSRIILCVGQGKWEDRMRQDTAAMRDIFVRKNIPAQVEFWGEDVYHDWPWWQKQIYHFLSQLNL